MDAKTRNIVETVIRNAYNLQGKVARLQKTLKAARAKIKRQNTALKTQDEALKNLDKALNAQKSLTEARILIRRAG